MKKLLVIILSGVFFSACNTTQTADTFKSRKVASVASAASQMDQSCPVLSQITLAMGQPDASAAVIEVLFKKDSTGNYPINNQACKNAVSAFAGSVCVEDPGDVICQTLQGSGLEIAGRMDDLMRDRAMEDFGENYSDWVRQGTGTVGRTVATDPAMVTGFGLITVGAALNFLKKSVTAKPAARTTIATRAGNVRKYALYAAGIFLSFSAFHQLKKYGVIGDESAQNLEAGLRQQGDLNPESVNTLINYLQEEN